MSRSHYQRWIGMPGTPVSEADFVQMTALEANRFVKEFVRRIPERIGEVERHIRSTHGFSTWRADFSPDSLAHLGKWLAKVVTTRPLTEAERTPRVIGRLPKGISLADIPLDDPPKFMISNESMSEIVDATMYFSDTLRHRDSRWIWQRNRSAQSVYGHNQPALTCGKKGLRFIQGITILGGSAFNDITEEFAPLMFIELYQEARKYELSSQ